MTVLTAARQRALEALDERYVERGNFLSDDDVLDAATDALDFDEADMTDAEAALRADLVDELFAQLTAEQANEDARDAIRLAMSYFLLFQFMAGQAR